MKTILAILFILGSGAILFFLSVSAIMLYDIFKERGKKPRR